MAHSHGLVSNLTAKIQLLVNELDKRGLLEDGQFTFPDGDVWKPEDTTAEIRIKIKDFGEVKEELQHAKIQLEEFQKLLNLLTLHFTAYCGEEH